MEQITYKLSEVAKMTESDAQTLRKQIHHDMDMGADVNEANFNAFRIGNKILIPRIFFNKKTGLVSVAELAKAIAEYLKENGIGPALEIGLGLAEWLVAHGWAVEVPDDQS